MLLICWSLNEDITKSIQLRSLKLSIKYEIFVDSFVFNTNN
jgi:hypothetical protein